MDVQGKVVVITGASMGIGAATASAFAGAGAKLVLASRSTDRLAAVADSLPEGAEVLIVPTDMTDQAQVQALIDKAHEQFGQIDILINNAGQTVVAPVETVTPHNYHQIIEVNIFGPLHAMQAVVPRMRAQGGGLIINVSSSVSKMAIPGIGAYASTKYALNGLSLTARNELEKDNIRVVLFHPGMTDTEFGNNATVEDPDYIPTPAPGQHPDTPEEVAQKILEAAASEPAEMEMPT